MCEPLSFNGPLYKKYEANKVPHESMSMIKHVWQSYYEHVFLLLKLWDIPYCSTMGLLSDT